MRQNVQFTSRKNWKRVTWMNRRRAISIYQDNTLTRYSRKLVQESAHLYLSILRNSKISEHNVWSIKTRFILNTHCIGHTDGNLHTLTGLYVWTYVYNGIYSQYVESDILHFLFYKNWWSTCLLKAATAFYGITANF